MDKLDLTKPSIIDWYNFCRAVFTTSKIMAHPRKLGKGQARDPSEELPNVFIQINECLDRGKRMYNREELLVPGDSEWHVFDQSEENIKPAKLEYLRFKRNAATLIPLIASNIELNTMTYSDRWAANNPIQFLEDGFSR
ncbi:hypothetical protein RF11_00273 [Thelohanellus kitauei]|uniref:Uncharacterized protein n=1 Tax=Thelohanellus kitauei TaxID=669202 RepID=A0A0C2J1H2_THEKT|nr:hypothetical protein RF11_00273 [Thelohanellus kitauei]